MSVEKDSKERFPLSQDWITAPMIKAGLPASSEGICYGGAHQLGFNRLIGKELFTTALDRFAIIAQTPDANAASAALQTQRIAAVAIAKLSTFHTLQQNLAAENLGLSACWNVVTNNADEKAALVILNNLLQKYLLTALQAAEQRFKNLDEIPRSFYEELLATAKTALDTLPSPASVVLDRLAEKCKNSSVLINIASLTSDSKEIVEKKRSDNDLLKRFNSEA